MNAFKSFVLYSSLYQEVFTQLLNSVAKDPRHLEFIGDAETITTRLFRTLLQEESGLPLCSPEQATYEGEQVLLLLERLSLMMKESTKNLQYTDRLMISTGVWIAKRQGVIKELGGIVNAIARFANQSNYQQEYEELYESSLYILYAVADALKADMDKRNLQRPWRLLCLNHCIIATYTGNGELAKLAYDRLIEYLPEEAEGFFNMGMQKLLNNSDSSHCRQVLQAYYQMFSSKYHQQPLGMNVSLN